MSNQPVAQEGAGNLIERDPVQAIENAAQRIQLVLDDARARACGDRDVLFVELTKGLVEEELELIREATRRLRPS